MYTQQDLQQQSKAIIERRSSQEPIKVGEYNSTSPKKIMQMAGLPIQNDRVSPSALQGGASWIQLDAVDNCPCGNGKDVPAHQKECSLNRSLPGLHKP